MQRASKCLWRTGIDHARVSQIQSLNWAKHVVATPNFLSCARSAGQTLAFHVRKANNMLLFEDSSVLLISEREAEHLLRAARVVPPDRVTVCLVNLAMCRWIADRVSNTNGSNVWCPSHSPLAVGRRALPRTPPSYSPQSLTTTLVPAVVSAQMFNGETEYFCDAATVGKDGNRVWREAVSNFVFGDQMVRHRARERAGAAETLVEVRGRRACWPGSDLESLCIDKVTVAKFRGSSRRHRPGFL